MALDIRSRLLPAGYLVNKQGAACRKGVNGLFYCGKKVLDGI